MIDICGLKFATNLGVMFALKEAHNTTTLQETYALLEKQTDIDLIFEVLLIAYNRQNKVNLSADDFAQLLGDNDIGFVKMTDIFKNLVEHLMFSGLTPDEIEERKNQAANLMNKK
jgi:hypothetical protein